MDLTKAKIDEFKADIEGLDGYKLIVSEIEDNLPENPDISIESCKSLIEGLCKKALEILSETYQESKNFRDKCDNKLPFLIQSAFDEVYAFNVVKEQHKSLYKLISDKVLLQKIIDKKNSAFKTDIQNTVKKVAAIRHTRGDISHGKIYPKSDASELHLAESIRAITDGICSYMIHELAIQYEIKIVQDKRLVYKVESNYNDWLDDQNDNLITKIDFSRLLFENSYEKYEEIYFAEYQDYLDGLKDEDSDESMDTQPVEAVQREVKNLINTFNEDEFWIVRRLEYLKIFADEEKYHFEQLKDFLSDYYFNVDVVTRNDVYPIMKNQPGLINRGAILQKELDKIIVFAAELEKITND